MADINTMTPAELRAELVSVCRVRDTLYAALEAKAHELGQRDARIAALEQRVRKALGNAQDNGFSDLFEVRRALSEVRHTLWRALNGEEASYYDAEPFEAKPAPESDHAPADLSMRGGLEYVKADPLKFIDHNYRPNMSVQHMAALLMTAFDTNEASAKRWITEWVIERNNGKRAASND